MKNRIINGFAGGMVLLSLSLFYITNETNWLLLGAFVGVNLFQSAFTKWCLLGNILDKIGVNS